MDDKYQMKVLQSRKGEIYGLTQVNECTMYIGYKSQNSPFLFFILGVQLYEHPI